MTDESLGNDIDTLISYSTDTPYQLIDLLKEIPIALTESTDSYITCIQSWELNLYIGTNLGEIIHLYKIDDELGYIQISKQKFGSSSVSKPIKKILLLPEISIALIHCGNSMSGYILPELSPANIGKAKDVMDISIDWNYFTLDKKENNYIVKKEEYYGESFINITLFTKKAIRLLRIFHDSIRLHKELEFSDVIKGIQLRDFAIVSNGKDYDLINVLKSQKLPLFPVLTSTSDENVKITPIIKYIDKNEILLISGGLNLDEPAMGMFINLNGDVIRGTLTFDHYPSSISIQLPYIIAIIKNEIQIFSIYDQTKLQTITINDKDIKLNTGLTCKIFRIDDNELTSKITLAPIVSTMTNEEIEKIAIESDNALKKSFCTSSCLLYDSTGKVFKILKPISEIDRWLKMYSESNSNNAQNIYEKLVGEFTKHNKSVFLITLMALFSLKYQLFDQAFDVWVSNFKHLDPRLMIYIFTNESESSNGIYGSVWTFQCLFEYVEELKKMEKNVEMNDFFKLYLNTCLTVEFKNENDLIKKSIEVTLVKNAIINQEDLEPIIHEIKHSSNEVIELLLLNKKYYILSKFYTQLKNHRQWLYYWKGLIDGTFKDEEFNTIFSDFNKPLQVLVNYIYTNCIEDNEIVERYAEWLLNNYPKYGLNLITEEKINNLDINYMKIINSINNNDKLNNKEKNELQLQYLEYIVEVKCEKQFIGDLILIYLKIIMFSYENDSKIEKNLNKSIIEYKEKSIPKLSVYKYWNIIKNLDFKGSPLVGYHDKLYTLLHNMNCDMKSILTQQSIIDICKELINNDGALNKLPLITIMIYFKSAQYEEIVDFLIELKDYSTVEIFAVELELPTIDENILKSVDMKNKTTSLLSDDLENNDNNNDKRKTTEILLKKIFDSYLKSNETKLIDNFLNKYDLLNDSTDSNATTMERMDNFVEIINKVPDNFPIDRMKNFLLRNLIEFKDYQDQRNIKAALIEVELNRFVKLHDLLSKSDENSIE